MPAFDGFAWLCPVWLRLSFQSLLLAHDLLLTSYTSISFSYFLHAWFSTCLPAFDGFAWLCTHYLRFGVFAWLCITFRSLLLTHYLRFTPYAWLLTSVLSFGGFFSCFVLSTSHVLRLSAYVLFLPAFGIYWCCYMEGFSLCGVDENTVAYSMFFSHFTDLRWMLVQWSCLESIAQRYLRPHAVSE